MARARTAVAVGAAGSYVEWSAIFAGAIGASAISFLLLTFGGSIGLTLTSPLPNASGLSAWGLLIAVGWWAVMVEIGSFFAGGYLAGRMRKRFYDSDENESDFRDAAHGFSVWALSIVIMVVIAAGAGGATLKAATQSASAFAGAAAATADKGGSATTADYAADLLLRPASGSNAQAAAGNPGQRDEVKRIFSRTITEGELNARDRDYLADIGGTRSGLSQADARSRVDQTIQETQKFEMQARQAADKARKVGVISGFLAAAALLIGLAAAVAGAGLGGRHRDERTVAHLFGTRFW